MKLNRSLCLTLVSETKPGITGIYMGLHGFTRVYKGEGGVGIFGFADLADAWFGFSVLGSSTVCGFSRF